jgi:hypothetical protein
MRNLGSIVGVLVLTVNNGWHHLAFRRTVASQFVRRQFNWYSFMNFQQFTVEPLALAA